MTAVVLVTEDWDTWLDRRPLRDEVLLPLLKAFSPDLMQLWTVSPAVLNPDQESAVMQGMWSFDLPAFLR